jgi:hypothetical protein
MTRQFWSVLPIWLLSLAAALVIGFAAPAGAYVTWVPIAFAGTVVATFIIQLAIRRKEGLVLRAMASIGVSLLILAAATGVLAIIG